ncbi:MAG: hypothetical protein COZ06_31670 [Armatimonadetes bacterium CG_4_10_14_3_um_filter_66_18]|nr:MAG: hypothetical protein COZ06_31670 [Armatimonadetes bacterium CG_4_10_14_3_um_filter_66_18]
MREVERCLQGGEMLCGNPLGACETGVEWGGAAKKVNRRTERDRRWLGLVSLPVAFREEPMSCSNS